MTPEKEALAVRHGAEEAAALFPALLIEAERIAQTVASGLHGRRRAGPGETFWQHRPYTFGDPVSAIDWRQSARVADRLYIRQNEWEAAAAVYLWRDPSQSLDYKSKKEASTKRRRAEILATALAILLSQAGERVGLLGQDRRPFQGRSTPSRILEALGAEKIDTAHSTPPVSQIPPGARVVMFSDFFAPLNEIDIAASTLAAGGVKGALVQICDPAEEDFPFRGRVEFRDMESADRLIFGETGSISAAYKVKFEAHRAALADLSRKLGWTFITHRTDRPAQTALLALYTALGDMRVWTK